MGLCLVMCHGLLSEIAIANEKAKRPGFHPTEGIKNLFNLSDVDVRPKPISQPPLPYPKDLQERGIGGSVVVEIFIGTKGDVIAAQILSSDHPELEAPTIEGARTWKFVPGSKRGKAVNVRASQKVEFTPPAKPSS